MNFIVNYNMLKSPSEIQNEKRMKKQETVLESKVENLKHLIFWDLPILGKRVEKAIGLWFIRPQRSI